ncbi:uncharacterized protein isoform X1 [Takifugu rubripes]|nr:uncharacterized protein LOC101071920 isoform X1 [Takifugu rubripes]
MIVVGVLLFGCAALSFSLPAPENLSIHSVNFNHTLSWNAGASTPVGTSYLIYDINRHERKLITTSKETSAKLNLEDQRTSYLLTVVASYNNSLSPDSPKLQFYPAKETKIGPPVVLLTGCGNCLHMQIILPEADSSSTVKIHNFYNPVYRITLRKQGKRQGDVLDTSERNYTLQNIHSGTEYCVQVHVDTLTINPNTQPSAWTCAFTSRPEPSTAPLAAGLVVVVVLTGLLMASVSCLYYLGFITRLKMMLPTALLKSLSPVYTLTPERTVPDLISISPKVEKHKQNSPAASQPVDQEEEEEEEEEGRRNIYVEKNTALYLDQSLCSDSDDGLCDAALPAAEPDCDEDEAGAEEEAQTDVREDVAEEEEASVAEEWEEEQDFNSLGDINLLSVTLKALDQPEEEEQTLEWTDQEALLPPDQTPGSTRTPVEDQSVPDEEEEEEEGGILGLPEPFMTAVTVVR